MFKSNNTGDHITRTEAATYVEGLDGRVASLRAEGLRELEALQRRVSALETLAAELRRSQSVPSGIGRVAGTLPTRAPFEGVTKAEASSAYNALVTAGQAEFKRLNDKIDALTAQRNTTAPQATSAVTQRLLDNSGIDYAAVAFGLSQIKRDVANVVGSEARTADLAAHYAATVQYFADVFAKSDPTFDADAFKRESGV